MLKIEKPPALVTLAAQKGVRLGGANIERARSDLLEYQARFLGVKFDLPPSTARAVAALAFQGGPQ